MKMKPTPGPISPVRLIDNDGNPYATSYQAHIDLDVCMIWAPPGNVEQQERAEFIAEAFNVHHETGLSPRELLEQRDAMLKIIERIDKRPDIPLKGSYPDDGIWQEITVGDIRSIRAAIAAARETKGEGWVRFRLKSFAKAPSANRVTLHCLCDAATSGLRIGAYGFAEAA